MKVSVKAYGNLRRYLKEGGGQAELLFDAPVSVGEVLLRLGIPVADAWRISVNGETLYEGSGAFPDKAYAVKSVVAPKKLLRKENTITVENLSPGDNPRGVPWFFINYIVVRPK